MLTRKWSLTILLVCALVFAVGAAAMAKSAIFWTAPNPSQEVFWHEMAKRFMAENPEYNIQILPMAEAPSSEATILTAIAGGTAPAASENIFIGFGAELVQSQALVPLDTMPGWGRADRCSQDGRSYQRMGVSRMDLLHPSQSTAIPSSGCQLSDILAELGVDGIPETYEEIIE